jgi:hypothetical protein
MEGRIRRLGAGRMPMGASDPKLEVKLEAILEETTHGDPHLALRWTLKSTRELAEALSRIGHPVSHPKVGQIQSIFSPPARQRAFPAFANWKPPRRRAKNALHYHA